MDKKNHIWIRPFFLLIVLGGCIENFDTEQAGINGLMVVDGMITDQPGPYRISLSRSASLKDSIFRQVRDALVYIEEENGAIEQLTERDAGIYFSSENGIRGQAGKKYQLTIQVDEGSTYMSDWVTLKSSPEIDSVYYLFEEQAVGNEFETGFQIYADALDLNDNVRFYKYEWIETWKYSAPFPSLLTYIGGDSGTDVEPSGRGRFCWGSDTSIVVNVGSSLNNSTTRISQHPITFVSINTNKLSIRYSILVRQIALDEFEFEFWKGLQETNEGNGSLFDKQPQVVTGNIKNINDPDEPVLGYFSASTISEKRIYISRSALPDGVSPDQSLLLECRSALDSIPRNANFRSLVLRQIDLGKVFFDFYGGLAINGALLTTPECSDCTLQGGVMTPPDFWTENDD